MDNYRFKMLFLCTLFLGSFMAGASACDFHKEVDITWGGDRAQILNGGTDLSLTLDQASGSGFQTKNQYLFGRIDMQIKLVGGNSAGTVTAFYLSSDGPVHDEIDYEFLGNISGQPYTIHTNVYTLGKGDREQQFHLWFDPTLDFHTYSFIWNPRRIIFLIDEIPIRLYENEELIGIPFPKKQPMKLYSSLWNADQWATRGGLIKTDWSKAPFTAYYRNFNAFACIWSSGSSSCSSKSTSPAPKTRNDTWETQGLDANSRKKLRWVQNYFMIYNYCTDTKRFPGGRPRECSSSSHV